MKKSLLFIMLLCAAANLRAQMRWNSQYQIYINQYKDLAIDEMKRYRIPASITLAQGLLESGAGTSNLARNGNNHFGIKCHNWQGATMLKTDDAPNECFRVYNNAFDSYEDHSRFLTNNSRYRRLFSYSITDYRQWAIGLKECGYATNPRYAQSLIEIIELYNLSQYDRATKYDKFMVRRSEIGHSSTQNTLLHPIRLYNNNYYLIARNGDTFKEIGREIGISYRDIARYNERNRKDPLHEGEIIYLKKKQNKAEKQFKNHPHTVAAGESLYDIAQKYGIKLKSLYRMNRLGADYKIKVGDKLRIR